MAVLTYPKKQSVAFSNILFDLYQTAKTSSPDEELLFDLDRSESLTPFGIILLTATIEQCLSQGKKCKYSKPRDSGFRAFLTEIGFHKFFDLPYEDPGRDSIETGRVHLKKVSGLAPGVIDTLIEILNYHLIISKGLKFSLRVSLLELMQNVVDHSGVTDYYLCCWNYPDRHQIRLCIADRGIGIRSSLRKSPDPRLRLLRRDHKAIVLATKKGVSSRAEAAGLGLSHIKEFLKVNKGQLCIISGRGKVFWKFDQGKTLEQKMRQNFEGTIVKMVINTAREGLYYLSDEEEYLF